MKTLHKLQYYRVYDITLKLQNVWNNGVVLFWKHLIAVPFKLVQLVFLRIYFVKAVLTDFLDLYENTFVIMLLLLPSLSAIKKDLFLL